jgi:hypothetical protein
MTGQAHPIAGPRGRGRGRVAALTRAVSCTLPTDRCDPESVAALRAQLDAGDPRVHVDLRTSARESFTDGALTLRVSRLPAEPLAALAARYEAASARVAAVLDAGSASPRPGTPRGRDETIAFLDRRGPSSLSAGLAREWSAPDEPEVVAAPAPRDRRGHPAAIALGGFLALAAAGTLMRGAPWNWIAAALALLVAAVAIERSYRRIRARRWLSVAPAGIGTTLLVFAALYAIDSAASPGQIVIDGHAGRAPTIAEHFLLSLSMAVAGGPMGLELSGFARVLAFVQLLLSLSALTALLVLAARWFASRLDGLPGPGSEPEPSRDERA